MLGKLLIFALLLSCTANKSSLEPPLAKKIKRKSKVVLGKPKTKRKPLAAPANCFLPKQKLPLAVGGLVIQRLLQECPERKGWYRRDSSWSAMGFPCTAGGGKIKLHATSYWAPKLVSFPLSLGCPMAPSREEVVSLGRSKLQSDIRLLVYNPFTVEFWALDEFSDSGLGAVVELRSERAKKQGWRSFLEKNEIKVHLYGQSSSLQPGSRFYVKAALKSIGRYEFGLQIYEVKVLEDGDRLAGLKRCLPVGGQQACQKIFTKAAFGAG